MSDERSMPRKYRNLGKYVQVASLSFLAEDLRHTFSPTPTTYNFCCVSISRAAREIVKLVHVITISGIPSLDPLQDETLP
mmetsp:Transcript_12602/g.18373  ORF Transcript_12602/g.18373 Transcript_12602/m.18373 type:complete len:80 (-) Transcript_12602:12-251(-)